MNQITIIGRMARDPEIKQTNSGKNVAVFAVAVDRRFKQGGQKVSDFFDIQAWDSLAELCARYLKKGNKVAIIGEAHLDTYEKNGEKRKMFRINAEQVEFLSPKAETVAEQAGFTDIEIGDSELPF